MKKRYVGYISSAILLIVLWTQSNLSVLTLRISILIVVVIVVYQLIKMNK